ncbi:MAG: nucleotidyltransferase domain-containing protein [Nanoarchaeota archaeon]
MPYTEVKERNGKKYFYRVLSVRKSSKVCKDRVYLGRDLSNEDLLVKQSDADISFNKKKITKGLDKIRPIIYKIVKQRGIKKAGIFGSYARGEQKKNSDIDILIEPSKDMGLFEVIELEDELKKKLKKKVDLLTYASIHKLLHDRILKEEVRIL